MISVSVTNLSLERGFPTSRRDSGGVFIDTSDERLPDTTAFKNAAQSNQRRSQLNFECGAVKIKGLIR